MMKYGETFHGRHTAFSRGGGGGGGGGNLHKIKSLS